ncbi:unnamed protein product [Effrenium voratum]|nr:unnamed protein product [Effrenium voratum]
MDSEEFGEDRGPEPQEAAEDVLNGSVNGGSARSVSWADQWTAAEWHEWYEQERLRWELRGQPGSRRESSAWSWEEDRDRGGGADKILVPEFSAEDDRDGVKARGYLRKIEAWRRVTKIKSYKQALMLYNHLTGRAWRDAEELDVEWLDGDSGMDYFIDWIRNRYLDREVIKVGKYMTDFFKNLKKHNNQDVKEFNQEFDRQAARLKEVGCALPDVCLAWWYMDKLRLDNATELNLLSSTGNDYNLYKLQDAAIIQDRMNRRLWESHRGRNNDKYDQNKKGQQAYVTEELGEGQSEDEESELDMDVEGIDEEAEEAYVTYQNAKSKYRTIMNARGINPKANQEERIKAAKARSYCSACKKKGHWHKDPECPLNQKNPQGDKRDAHQVKFCHVAYMTDSTTETELYGITDCACSRTVAGRPWIRRMVRKAKENNIPYFFMAQEENFKFGGPDIFRSERALVVWLQINGAPFILKIAEEVKCVLPLLLSRNVLAGLGMCYDISKHVADFSELGVEGYKLGQTETGHPMVVVTGGDICWPSWPEAVDWSVVECDVHRPARSCYMVHGGAGNDMRTELAVDRPPIRYMPELKPWKMKRAELVEKLDDLLIDYDQKATVPELQEILKKHLTKTEELAKGYTRFTVGELREMCNKKKLRVPATANKGCLIQALRYAEGGHSKEEISFGRYKGKTYEAIPMDYRLWAVEEVSKNETPAAALVRFATWAKRWMELEALEEEVIDPEEAAVVAPPKSTMDFKPTIRKKAMTSTTTAKRATPATSDSDGSWLQADPMDSETDADANKKILELETQLAILRQKQRRYWAVREGRAKQKAVAKFEKIGEPRESSGDLTVNEDNLDYDDDIEHRINSRRGRKVKNSTRKMIGSWTRKVWQAFLSTAVALAGPVMVEANEAVVEPIKDLYNATVLPRFEEEGQPYVLEVFAGKNHITQAFAAKGYDVMEPRDLLLGHDIRIKEVRENILEDIRKFKPKLVWLAPPCTLWSPWTRINYYGRANQLRRLRQRERMFQEFAEECARLQRSGGRHIIIENPAQSELWHTPRMTSIIKDYHLLECNLDMCAYGLKGKSDGKLLKKPTKLLVSSEIYHHELARRCDKRHDHGQTAGANTAPSACYTWGFARAVVEATCKVDSSYVTAYVADAGEEDVGGDQQPEDDLVGASGIKLPKATPAATASALRRIHQNLGHPSNKDLTRHLRLCGATEEAIKGAQGLRCDTCQRLRRPGTQRPARTVLPMDFNDEVAVDLFYLYDQGKVKHSILSVMDLASGYHVCRKIQSKLSEDLAESVRQLWLEWAGMPKRMVCDQERGFQKNFVDEMENRGIHVKYIAGQAHWQLGQLERQQGWLRTMWETVVEHENINFQEAEWALLQVVQAKNNLRRRHGYSPAQWVLGVQPRMEDGLADGGQELLPADTAGGAWSRKMAIQRAARMAFFESQATEAVRRAALGRPRVKKNEYQTGDIVYIYRVKKTPGGAGSQRQGAGQWIGPGTVVGAEGGSVWVSRGGRCLLCAQEHLRPAESSELGTLFQVQSMQKDLRQLLERIDDDGVDDEEIFHDASNLMEDGDAEAYRKQKRQWPDGVPRRRMRQKGPVPHAVEDDLRDGEDEYSPSVAAPDEEITGMDFVNAYVDKSEGDDIQDVDEAMWTTHKRTPKTVAKQRDKEVAWNDIPAAEKELYVAAEKKQWDEHVKYGAVRILSAQESEEVMNMVHPSRILNSRFAYRDKNVAKRREDPAVPPKPKARLCIAGHRDPDLTGGGMETEAPTVSKTSLSTLLLIAAQEDWELAAGDVQAAFLNGEESRRGLYMRQPVRGLPEMEPNQLVEVVKGIFGLANSPRLWWKRLAKELLALDFVINSETLKLEQHPLDSCFFLLRNAEGVLRGALVTHVDDILIAAAPQELVQLKKNLSGIFPIAEWEDKEFEYIGSQIKQADGVIELGQCSYVKSRLETTEMPKEHDAEELADEVTKMDNQSVVGGLSWLASQTRPDLQTGVSMAQRKQRAPTYGDVKETNKIVKLAQECKGEVLKYQKIGSGKWSDMVLLVFHDAAWANVPEERMEDFYKVHGKEADFDINKGIVDQGVYSQLGHVLVMAHRNVLEGEKSKAVICEWKSHACPRVCRSTFAAETMAALEGIEDAMAFRASLAGALRRGGLDEGSCRDIIPIVPLTDCRSLYDAIKREGGPKAPSEKRLLIDLSALRQLLDGEFARWGKELRWTTTMRWIPTTYQLADLLTKVKKSTEWWSHVHGVQLPFCPKGT